MKKLGFLAADFGKCRKEKFLSNMTRGTLILKDCDIASYPCSNYGPSNLLSRAQIFVKKYKIMRTFDIRFENGWFCHSSLVKAVRNRQSKQMKIWKLAF